MKALVLTCNKYVWAVRPFARLFQKYWSKEQEVEVMGGSPPAFALPSSFVYRTAPFLKNGDWPVRKFSDGLIWRLERMREEVLLISVADFWLLSKVPVDRVNSLAYYLNEHENLVRLDLYSQAPFNEHGQHFDAFDGMEIVHCPGHHHCGGLILNFALFHRKRLLGLLEEGWTPWETEDVCTAKMRKADLYSIAVRPPLFRNVHALYKDQPERCKTTGMKEEDFETIRPMIPGNYTRFE